MNTCKDLIEQFNKSINCDVFKVKYNWVSDGFGYYDNSSIIGMYDNKTCDMTFDDESKLSNNKLLKNWKYDTLYSNWLKMYVPSCCEITKNK